MREPCTSEACPACRTACGGDPIACACAMWTAAFFQAMKQAQVDVLKTKIQKAWGAKMDKAADIILEAMGVKWQSMVAEAKARVDVRERLMRLWQEGQK
jgi:hypothetical protein